MKLAVNLSMRAVSAEHLRRWPNWREKRARFPWWRWPGAAADKGNKANVGIIARKPEFLPYIYHALSEQEVRARFAHFLENDSAGAVQRFLLPGSNAVNFLLHNVLGGGGVASIRNDPQGKGYAQLLLSCPVTVPAGIAESLS